MEETETTVSELEFTTKPDAFVLHSVTNDIKTHSPQDCVDKMEDIIQVLKGKFDSTKIIISLPTPRLDNSTVNNKSFQLSAMLKENFQNDEAIYMCDNSNLAYKGEALKRYVGDDGVHLTTHGVSLFASNIRDTIDEVLDLPKRITLSKRNNSNYMYRGEVNNQVIEVEVNTQVTEAEVIT